MAIKNKYLLPFLLPARRMLREGGCERLLLQLRGENGAKLVRGRMRGRGSWSWRSLHCPCHCRRLGCLTPPGGTRILGTNDGKTIWVGDTRDRVHFHTTMWQFSLNSVHLTRLTENRMKFNVMSHTITFYYRNQADHVNDWKIKCVRKRFFFRTQ